MHSFSKRCVTRTSPPSKSEQVSVNERIRAKHIGSATTDVEIMGHMIPKDTMITPQYCRVLAKDAVFVDPNDFRPERFLEDDGKTFNKVVSFAIARLNMGLDSRRTAGCFRHGQATVSRRRLSKNAVIPHFHNAASALQLRSQRRSRPHARCWLISHS